MTIQWMCDGCGETYKYEECTGDLSYSAEIFKDQIIAGARTNITKVFHSQIWQLATNFYIELIKSFHLCANCRTKLLTEFVQMLDKTLRFPAMQVTNNPQAMAHAKSLDVEQTK